MPDLPVDAGDGPQGKLRRSEGGSDENAFDICFGCCPISAWISVFHPSVSHELEAKEKRRRRGRGCLVIPSFEISPLDIISAAPTAACAKSIPLFLLFCCSPPVHPFAASTGSRSSYKWLMIFTTAPDARAKDFTSDKTNIPYIFSSAFKIKPAAGATPPRGSRDL